MLIKMSRYNSMVYPLGVAGIVTYPLRTTSTPDPASIENFVVPVFCINFISEIVLVILLSAIPFSAWLSDYIKAESGYWIRKTKSLTIS